MIKVIDINHPNKIKTNLERLRLEKCECWFYDGIAQCLSCSSIEEFKEAALKDFERMAVLNVNDVKVVSLNKIKNLLEGERKQSLQKQKKSCKARVEPGSMPGEQVRQ